MSDSKSKTRALVDSIITDGVRYRADLMTRLSDAVGTAVADFNATGADTYRLIADHMVSAHNHARACLPLDEHDCYPVIKLRFDSAGVMYTTADYV